MGPSAGPPAVMTYADLLRSLRGDFPSLTAENSRPTSPFDVKYNCIAWAAQDDSNWWWPDRMNLYYWPRQAPRIESIEAFKIAYGTIGYTEPTTEDLDDGLEKVAIYASSWGAPTHAARQLPDGWWASKLGRNIDIEHELRAVEGPVYGSVAVILSRTAR